MRIQRFVSSAIVASGLAIPGLVQNGFAQSGPANVFNQFSTTSGPTSYLGVNLQEVSTDRAKSLKLPEEAGVEITRVEMNSPASAAGLQSGDVVTDYNGQRVEGIEQFSRMVRETPAGRDVKLKVYRNGVAQTMTAKIASHQQAAATPFNGNHSPLFSSGAWPDSLPTFQSTMRSSALGLEAEALNGQLADYFGVKEGVLVRSVMKDSAADKAGIKAGDVIIKAGDSKIATPGDLSSRIRPSVRRQSVSLTLMRDHKEMTLTVQGDAQGAEKLPLEKL